MSTQIFDLIKDQLGSSFVSEASNQLGENESGISKALGALLPVVLGGLANNSNNSTVLDTLSNSSSSGLLGNLFGNSSNNSMISTLLSAIFGDKIGGLVNTISNFSGLSNSSSSSLLDWVTGATTGTIGKYASDNNLGRSGIASLLDDQKGIVSSLLPAGLSLASLGIGNWFGSDDKENVTSTYSSSSTSTSSHTTRRTDDDNGGGGMGWLKWLIPLILLLLLGAWLFKQCKTDKNAVDTEEVITDTIAVDTIDTTVATSTERVEEEVDLNGTKLKAFQGGLEGQLINYLQSGQYDKDDETALKEKWYTFDNVNFKMGSATDLEEGSQNQLDNLVAILKAFPNAKIKIGGYTDKTGDAAKNKALSQSRADFIKKTLTDAGVGGQVLGAEGYGSEFATVPAEASDDERAVDRKMAIRFAK